MTSSILCVAVNINDLLFCSHCVSTGAPASCRCRYAISLAMTRDMTASAIFLQAIQLSLFIDLEYLQCVGQLAEIYRTEVANGACASYT